MFEEFTHQIICSTHQTAEYEEIKRKLKAADIHYKIRHRNQTGRRTAMGSAVNTRYDYIYNIYVKRKDYDAAMFALRKK